MADKTSDTPQWVKHFLWHSERYGMLLSRCQAILRKAGIPEVYIGESIEEIEAQAGLTDRDFADQADFEAALSGWALNRAAELAAARPTPPAGNGQDVAPAGGTIAAEKPKAGADRAAPGPRKGTVNARMLELVQRDLERVKGWTAAQWAAELRCARSAIVQTATWKDLEMARARQRVEKQADRRRRKRPAKRD